MEENIETSIGLNSRGDKLSIVQVASAPPNEKAVVDRRWRAVQVVLYGDNRGYLVQLFLGVGCWLVDHLKSLNNWSAAEAYEQDMASVARAGLAMSDQILK